MPRQVNSASQGAVRGSRPHTQPVSSPCGAHGVSVLTTKQRASIRFEVAQSHSRVWHSHDADSSLQAATHGALATAARESSQQSLRILFVLACMIDPVISNVRGRFGWRVSAHPPGEPLRPSRATPLRRRREQRNTAAPRRAAPSGRIVSCALADETRVSSAPPPAAQTAINVSRNRPLKRNAAFRHLPAPRSQAFGTTSTMV
jgi:hypothetical protein